MIYQLLPTDKPFFPDPNTVPYDYPGAIGGKLTPEWLLEAYKIGFFPWYLPNEPILWWSPNPRAVMKPSDVIIHKSMRPYFNQKKFELRIDFDFEQVIRKCKTTPRKDEPGTWITDDIVKNYVELHKLGYAHSFEAWQNNKLVGGLYGVSLGRMFFGESMFSTVSNASKFAFISMCQILEKNNFTLIDCQVPNDHLKFLGCGEMERVKFIKLLKKNNSFKTLIGNWNDLLIK